MKKTPLLKFASVLNYYLSTLTDSAHSEYTDMIKQVHITFTEVILTVKELWEYIKQL